MPKNIFFKSTLILLIGGFFTKILGLIIKIIFTRILKEPGIALYSLIMPTYSLLISLANFNIQYPLLIALFIGFIDALPILRVWRDNDSMGYFLIY